MAAAAAALQHAAAEGDGWALSLTLSALDPASSGNVAAQLAEDEDLREMAALRLRARQCEANADWRNAFEAQMRLCSMLQDAVIGGGNLWLMPVLTRSADDLRKLAIACDAALQLVDEGSMLQETQSFVSSLFAAVMDRKPITSPETKKIGAIAVTNVLLKIYFHVNNLTMAKSPMNVIERPGAPFMDNLHLFPKGDVITYHYYKGRLCMMEDRYREARECLMFAFKSCKTSHWANRRKILLFLIPVNMCVGILPRPELLQKYNLPEFVQLVESVRTGNIRQFSEAMNQHQALFIARGIFLVLEQTRSLAYRNLFKLVYRLKATPNARLELRYLAQALEWLGQPADLAEVECILVNLIFDGKVRGYVAHAHGLLVASKDNAFPTDKVVRG